MISLCASLSRLNVLDQLITIATGTQRPSQNTKEGKVSQNSSDEHIPFSNRAALPSWHVPFKKRNR